MKRLTVYIGTTITAAALVTVGLTISNSAINLNILSKASSSITYKHYNAIAPTDNEHGCVEFWVSCSDYSFYLSAPSEGNIVEGGDITDNPSFAWNDMNILDDRYIPSLNEQRSWGMIPTVDLGNNKITYGLYPQTLVSDSSLISTLNTLGDEYISSVNGFYYYDGVFYQTCIGYRCDSDSHFADGTKVVDGTKYWFTCEPISWVIMSNSGSTYQMYSEKALHGGINWGYTNSDAYEQSQVREWLNGIGFFEGEGFFQTALFSSNQYVQKMTISLDDGSSTLNDNVRLLTKDEANDSYYFANDNARKLVPTDWAAAHKVCFQSGSSSFTRWWLCEANTVNTNNAWGVGLGGAVGNGGPKTGSDSYDRAERPVITINVD